MPVAPLQTPLLAQWQLHKLLAAPPPTLLLLLEALRVQLRLLMVAMRLRRALRLRPLRKMQAAVLLMQHWLQVQQLPLQ